jgi:hypothetical protein
MVLYILMFTFLDSRREDWMVASITRIIIIYFCVQCKIAPNGAKNLVCMFTIGIWILWVLNICIA